MKYLTLGCALFLIMSMGVLCWLFHMDHSNANLHERILQGNIARISYGEYSVCARCGRPWPVCDAHETFYTQSNGCFPLCEDCWKELTPTQRLPYYRGLWLEWQHDAGKYHYKIKPDSVWVQIQTAVLAGR